ncbi:hypothetical protein HY635_01310 [Candidatus Uhrbacteria bacterium]|nr:hypothetical protein [Candidatus Uhrbacteria bacterium]
MIWFIFALIYVAAGVPIGFGYAFFTGVSGPTFSEVVALSATFGPVIIMVLAGFREAAKKAGVPIALALYHTILIAFAAPMFIFGIALILDALGAPSVARLLKSFSYWSIPFVFINAGIYGILCITRQMDRRCMSGATGGPGVTPPSGSNDPGTRPATAQRAEASGSPEKGTGMRMVACFSSRGTPFRLVPRSGS